MTIETNRGKVTANKNILNYISVLACEAADKYRQDGANALAKDAELFSDMIYEVLKESGLYND
jgi:hypothetical protein